MFYVSERWLKADSSECHGNVSTSENWEWWCFTICDATIATKGVIHMCLQCGNTFITQFKGNKKP